ncbi:MULTISPECIES: hypothetical protein [unclassified Rhodococcus (in: high G+C Gram-positive bacteria)]|uniref:hypothetical protein n=1 Tax=unclassified Rhodococcus (in: high G+C Gram-positive bacteria) TaxID=192944 RepID=UPI0015C687D4|nr:MULTISPECIES: hypothetical protein [unclassified Rhodococcus (in: high G+C Gram-positive bacteria)]
MSRLPGVSSAVVGRRAGELEGGGSPLDPGRGTRPQVAGTVEVPATGPGPYSVDAVS